MRLCFLVKVRKAMGRKVAAGSEMGRTVGRVVVSLSIRALNRGRFGATGGRIGCAGVAKAGDEEGIGLGALGPGVFGGGRLSIVAMTDL